LTGLEQSLFVLGYSPFLLNRTPLLLALAASLPGLPSHRHPKKQRFRQWVAIMILKLHEKEGAIPLWAKGCRY
jgi:hypothetical protein